MKYDSGFTPVPQDYSAQQRQGIIDGMNDRIADEEARVEEKRDNFYNTLLPLCDETTENARVARQVAYRQNQESTNLFTQYKNYQHQIEQLQYQQKQKMNAAMAKYSGYGMRAQRDKAGAEASAEFEKQISQMQGFMTQSFDKYSLQQIQAGLANEASSQARFAQTSAFNDVFSESISLMGAELDLGKLKNQRGFFEGMA